MFKSSVDTKFKAYIKKRLSSLDDGVLEFDPQYRNISDTEVEQLVEILKDPTEFVAPVTEIVLSSHQLGDGAASALATLDIQTLDLSGNNIGPKGAESLAKNETLQTLILSSNPIEDDGAVELSMNQNIHTLKVANCGITSTGGKALLSSGKLKDLDLSGNGITEDDIPELIPKRIESLNLSNNFIGPEGAERLAKSSSIEWLNLSDNDIGNKGAASFSENKVLKELFLDGNNLDDGCADALSNMSAGSERLGLAYNGFSKQAQALLFSESHKKKRKMIDLSNNGTEDIPSERPNPGDLKFS